MILTDLHVHPQPWRGGRENLRACARAAVDAGVMILGFAEHGPPPHPDPRYYGLSPADLDAYVADVLAVREEFAGDLQVFCGLELDWMLSREELYRRLKEQYPFDYFLGSVHLIDDWHLEDPETLAKSRHRQRSPEDLYRLYYGQVREAAQSGLFEILAHLDYLRRSLPHAPGEPPDFAPEVYAEVAAEIASQGVAVEVNARGLSPEAGAELHPTAPLLARLVREAARFTLGSDAHEASRVGTGLKIARMALLEAGVDRLHYFKRYRLQSVEI